MSMFVSLLKRFFMDVDVAFFSDILQIYGLQSVYEIMNPLVMMYGRDVQSLKFRTQN